MKCSAATRRAGFTLVELLMVIVIIGLLMAMVIPAIYAAQLSAKNAAITSEIGQLDIALKSYKASQGDYPPDPSYPNNLILRHMRLAYPRFTPPTNTANNMAAQIRRMTAAEAIVFWLGGYWDGAKTNGFYADATNPLLPYSASGNQQRTAAFFQFKETQLGNNDSPNRKINLPYLNGQSWSTYGWNVPEYYPPGVTPGSGAPYVYFKAGPNGQYSSTASYSYNGTYVYPYLSDKGGYMNPKGYQIICAGLDNNFGLKSQSNPPANRSYPSGKNYSQNEADLDNLTNFSNGTLKSARP